MTSSQHVYEVRARKDKRGVDLISDVLPLTRLWYDTPDNAIGYAMHFSRSHDAVIRVYDEAGNVIGIGRTSFVQHRFVTITEEPAPKPMPAIVAAGISILQPLHSGDQIGFRRFQHEVIMICHQDPGVHLPTCLLTRFAQRFAKESPVLIVPENAFPPIPAGHDMIERPWIFNANRTRHLGNI